VSSRAPIFSGFLSLLVLVLSPSASAALLETPTQLAAHYGKPLDIEGNSKTGGTYTYRWKRLTIVVHVIEHRSRDERYFHRDNTPLTTGEIQALLDLNALGHAWRRNTDAEQLRWRRSDSKAVAHYDEIHETHVLQISTSNYETWPNEPKTPNQALERTADRRESLLSMTSTLKSEAQLALVSDRSACSR
jgi:hypothetical protein